MALIAPMTGVNKRIGTPNDRFFFAILLTPKKTGNIQSEYSFVPEL